MTEKKDKSHDKPEGRESLKQMMIRTGEPGLWAAIAKMDSKGRLEVLYGVTSRMITADYGTESDKYLSYLLKATEEAMVVDHALGARHLTKDWRNVTIDELDDNGVLEVLNARAECAMWFIGQIKQRPENERRRLAEDNGKAVILAVSEVLNLWKSERRPRPMEMVDLWLIYLLHFDREWLPASCVAEAVRAVTDDQSPIGWMLQMAARLAWHSHGDRKTKGSRSPAAVAAATGALRTMSAADLGAVAAVGAKLIGTSGLTAGFVSHLAARISRLDEELVRRIGEATKEILGLELTWMELQDPEYTSEGSPGVTLYVDIQDDEDLRAPEDVRLNVAIKEIICSTLGALADVLGFRDDGLLHINIIGATGCQSKKFMRTGY